MAHNPHIDQGLPFDWGKTSEDYARYRDIYPQAFFQPLLDAGLCRKGQSVLDLGTGTGVLPRHLYRFGASFAAIDPVENQIRQARKLSEAQSMDIEYHTMAAEEITFAPQSFDVVTACQCFFYFDHKKALPLIARVLKPQGKLVILYMAWLPEEDPVARASEELVLKYSPAWSGARYTRQPVQVPSFIRNWFDVETSLVFDLDIPFTRESWQGRIRACRGVGASLSDDRIEAFEKEHRALLEAVAPLSFTILHSAAVMILGARNE